MGFICGIIDFGGRAVTDEEITSLTKSVGYPGFILHTLSEGLVSVGYCHHPERQPKAGIHNDEELLVVADCRIYDNMGLRKHFDFNSAEEALAKAYRKWGCFCADHINGDFSAVVFDKRKQEVCLFRDHIGTRPLVYWKSDKRMIFASHEFGLAKSGLIPVSLSERKVLDSYFRYDELYSETFFSGIDKVMPGHYMVCSKDGLCRSGPYWKPKEIKKDRDMTFDGAVAGLRERIVSATLSRMETGKTGIHVSGGLDSCGVASIVADNSPDKGLLTGYSWSPEIFDQPFDGVNEKPFIQAFAEEKNVNVKYLKIGENEMAENAIVPEFEKQHIELPVMKMAEADGIETLFSGWGGDEFVSLSLRGTVNHLFFSLKWGTLLRYAISRGIKATILQFRTEVLPCLVPFGLLSVYKTDRTDWSILGLLRPSFVRKHWRRIFLHHKKNVFGYGNRTKFVLNLLDLHHIPERMESWAINAERYGFDYKYPLLDKEVLEFWFSLPEEYSYKDFQSRLLYREAMRGILTEKIRTRKEKGEALRIAFSFKGIEGGGGFVKDLFCSLPPEEHLPFFRPDAVLRIFNLPFSRENLMKSIKNWRKKTFYLRCVILVKKYVNVDMVG